MIYRFLFFAGLITCCACSTAEKKAAKHLQAAQTLYSAGDTVAALAQIDTVTRLYAHEVRHAAAAVELRKTIYSDIVFRQQSELDSLAVTIAALEKNFTQEKTEFDRYMQYMHKRQNPEQRWNQSYLQIRLDETGALSLVSNYCGSTWLNHTSVRVYDGDLQAQSNEVPIDSPLNHHSDFDKTKWEKISFPAGSDGGIIELIATNPSRKFKAVFRGKQQQYILLEEFDRKAFADAVSLSAALKRRAALRASIEKLK
ncbi:MAG: hypothetical protein LBR06_10675 [Bacteroidales bacterium]|jgi:hypothetical protein|nr:hypothetical protein [Bacteroidales bacterium]